ncbi:hypothetical protein HYV11_03900 [Candidatus Dependentiae bacterium]|nr:hypothetical protein [Candidatus Dependentiae bacterium]
MVSFLGGIFNVPKDKYERLKFILLTVCFSFVIGAYTIAKELKDSVFVNVVGADYLASAKFATIFLLIPAALFYSKLVDIFRRYQLLIFYTSFYGLILAVFAIFMGHSTIGLSNTVASPYRLFGWFYYFLLEGFSPFVVGVFWAFANSVANPKEARNYYPLMVTGSKIGGIATALFAWYLLKNMTILSRFGYENLDVFTHQILMAVVSVLLLCVPVILMILMKVVPGHYLHGYEAVYRLEKEMSKTSKSDTGMFSGLKMLLESPYIFGIFATVFFYETLNVVLNFQRIYLLKSAASSMADLTASMFWQRFTMHFWGLLLSCLGVQFLLRRFGVRQCLLFIPFLISVLLLFFIYDYSAASIGYIFVGLGAINYSFSTPLREALYIPTVKDMKFKAKAWIDTFGTKMSKGSGSFFAWISGGAVAGASVLSIYILFFTGLMSLWFVAAWLLGRRYDQAIQNNEIIGKDLE